MAGSILGISGVVYLLATRNPQIYKYVMIWSYPILSFIPLIHERYAPTEVSHGQIPIEIQYRSVRCSITRFNKLFPNNLYLGSNVSSIDTILNKHV